MIIVTVCNDHEDKLNRQGLQTLALDFVSKVYRSLLREDVIIDQIDLKYRSVAEIEFFLENPRDHAFGLYAGYEIRFGEFRLNPSIVKRIALIMEKKGGKKFADIDVFSFNPKTKKLKKYTRYSPKPKIIIKKYTRT